MSTEAIKMDRMYRLQRHFYDLTRKYYLLGRDDGLRHMAVKPDEHVLEVGCGTARNLARLLVMQPQARYFGLDASQEMLKTASKNLAKIPGGKNVVLKTCLAEELCHRATFELNRPFDVILFSYTLSMIPSWRDALKAARANLAPNGRIVIIDFWDQRELPRWFANILVRWLALFEVHHRPELITCLEDLSQSGNYIVNVDSVWKRYAFVATLHVAA
jgi:S-adenosylmethionine-diacylgycerolhomoserine-N-methlytransferase